jgi:hypothetical protein
MTVERSRAFDVASVRRTSTRPRRSPPTILSVWPRGRCRTLQLPGGLPPVLIGRRRTVDFFRSKSLSYFVQTFRMTYARHRPGRRPARPWIAYCKSVVGGPNRRVDGDLNRSPRLVDRSRTLANSGEIPDGDGPWRRELRPCWRPFGGGAVADLLQRTAVLLQTYCNSSGLSEGGRMTGPVGRIGRLACRHIAQSVTLPARECAAVRAIRDRRRPTIVVYFDR